MDKKRGEHNKRASVGDILDEEFDLLDNKSDRMSSYKQAGLFECLGMLQ